MRGMWLVSVGAALTAVLIASCPLSGAAGVFCEVDDLDSVGPATANGRLTPVPSVRALKLDGETIELDGVLDEDVWQRAEGARGFSKWDPARGDLAQEETVFKVAYDDEAIYIGVACLESDCANITGRLCRRDNMHDSDMVSLYLDTYHDHTTGFNFRVNSLGVKGDRYVYNDGNMDPDWDAVWDAETSRDEHGWYAEMRIPFSCVRYRRSGNMTWGCNLYRWMHTRGQDSCWTVWDTETRGFISRFGEITGLIGVPHSRQLEVMPYAVARATDPAAVGEEDELDHFENFGLDLKYGVASNFTLTAAFQPDFGQVEADPSLLNLSPFETYYDEKRPFFLEGNRYFEHPRFNVFYSRRIGTGDENSRIRVASKLTGKTSHGLSVAALYAATDVTAEGQAHNFLKSGEQLAHRFVGRVGKEFADGAHRLYVMQTGVVKTADREEYGDYDSRDSFTTAMDFDLNFHDREYNVNGTFVGSLVAPEEPASDPSVPHARRYGTGGTLDARKLGGTFIGGVSGRWETDDLDLNDAGFLSAPDEMHVDGWFQVNHNSTRDDALFTSGNASISMWRDWLYAGATGRDVHTGEEVWSYGPGHPTSLGGEISGWSQLSNFWNVWSGFGLDADSSSRYHSRTFTDTLDVTHRGPLMTLPSGGWFWLGFSTDYRKPVAAEVNFSTSRNRVDAWHRDLSMGVGWTATDAVNLNLSLGYSRSRGMAAHLDNFENPGGGIGGVSYVFAQLDQQTLNATFRSDVLFNRDVSLQLYAQPYMTVGGYSNPRELQRPRSFDLERPDDIPGFDPGDVHDYDFRYFAMNINAVLRWEYRPGSTLYLVWKQGRDIYDDRFERPDLRTELDPGDLLGEEPENTFLAKLTYWFSI